jgi:hypothetical protein
MKRGKALAIIVTGLCCAGLENSAAQLAQPRRPERPYVANQQGPSGGTGGGYCETNDVNPTWKLKSINVWSSSWIDRIDMEFDEGKAEPRPVHCGGTGGQPNRVLTLAPREYIVRVKGRYGNFVDYLYVQTNGPSGMKFRDFGNKNSTAMGEFDYIAPEGLAIAGFVIRSGTYVDAVGVVLRKRP